MKDIANFIRDDIKSMSAYRIADLPEGFIKLDAMKVRIIRLPVFPSCQTNGCG